MCGLETPELAEAAVEGGADIVELGFPFSDPLADGPVIRRAGERALAQGMRTAACLECLATTRRRVDVPLIPMTYASLLEAYGYERFAAAARDAGATSLIVADLPVDAEPALRRVQLVAPTSTDERIALAAERTDDWLYLVTVTGTTGGREGVSPALRGLVERARRLTDLPLYAGFGISTPEDAAEKGAHPLDRLPIALTAGKRLVDPPGSLSLDLEDRATVQRPVIALAQACVLADRNGAVPEGELGRLDRAAEIGGVTGVNPLAPPALAEAPRKPPPFLRELTLEPPGRDPGLVVGTDRVRLEDDLGCHSPATASTAEPRSRPLRMLSSASFACSSANASTTVRTGTCGASARNSSPSRRVRLATERSTRSSQSSSYGKAGMSVMWMPAQTTLPPFASARSASGTSAPTGAKMMAASSSSGGRSSEPPAQTAPSSRANACPSSSPGRVKAKTRRPSCLATCAMMCAEAPKP